MVNFQADGKTHHKQQHLHQAHEQALPQAIIALVGSSVMAGLIAASLTVLLMTGCVAVEGRIAMCVGWGCMFECVGVMG